MISVHRIAADQYEIRDGDTVVATLDQATVTHPDDWIDVAVDAGYSRVNIQLDWTIGDHYHDDR